jgi:DNA-binding MarR family transcriptional regulator
MEEAPLGQTTRHSLGFLLAKASQRWNELLYAAFCRAGYAEVRPAYGSILLPLFEQDGLLMGELARRARLSKQTMTTLVRAVEANGLARRVQDPADRRAYRIYLTERADAFRTVAEQGLAELETLAAASLTPEEVVRLKDVLRTLMDLDVDHQGGD